MSSCSTLRSEPTFQPKSIPEEELQSPTDFTPPSPEPKCDTVINIPPALSSTPEVCPISLSAPTSPALIVKSTDTGNASDTIQEETKASQDVLATNNPLTPWQLSLRIMDRASSQVLCQRLAENWEGIESDLREHIDFEKRLWALNALKRLDGGQRVRPGMESSPVEGPKGRELKVVQICGIGGKMFPDYPTVPWPSNVSNLFLCYSGGLGSCNHESPVQSLLPFLDTWTGRTWVALGCPSEPRFPSLVE